MSHRASALLTLALLVFALAVVPSLYAQAVSTGTVVGQVTDQSGAAVGGAAVALTDISTNATRSTTTNAEGRYVYVDVVPGVYDLTVTQKGFRTTKVTKQTVTLGNQLTLNVKLELGVATETVEVVATTGAELQTLNSTVGATFGQVYIDALPSIGRDVSSFATLQPGVTPDGSVAGAIYDQNTFQLDGGQNTNDMDGSMTIYTPSVANDASGVTANCGDCYGGVPTGVIPTPIDSIEEFKVNTSSQTADFNSSAGAQISMVTRRGHDAWHGTAYEYYLNNIWNANSWTNNAEGLGIPAYHYSRFGGAVGGPIVPKKILGGKTYFFGMYEGFRWDNSETIIKDVPGPGLEQGLIALQNCGTTCTAATPTYTPMVYNLQPGNVTYSGPTLYYPGTTTVALMSGAMYSPGVSTPAGGLGTATPACVALGVGTPGYQTCDPRNLGISPTMAALWALMPQGNYKVSGAFAACGVGPYCDGVNILGWVGNLSLPQRSDFAVARIDHDFGDKEHFFSSYRFYRLTRATDNQTLLTPADGGAITALANRPQIPWFFVAGLTSNITTNFTNDFHYNYLRNWWLWGDSGAPPQLPGLGAALEPGGEIADGGQGLQLTPYNVNNQSIRQRYWDGQDNLIRDDMTRLLGNHVLQWGGSYQHNYNQHSRNDNGGAVNEYPTYVLSDGIPTPDNPGVAMAGYIPAGLDATNTVYWNRDYANMLGMLSIDQYVASRSVSTLQLNPPLTPIEDRVDIPYYNVYFTDSWHIKPTVTITYGLAWALEMPPYEQNGEQVVLVNSTDQPINIMQYLNQKKHEALEGNVFNPEIGYSLVRNTAGGQKYPYNPYYGEFAPRLAVAWSPNYDSGILGSVFGRSKSVVRGGFAIIYGRLNGVDLVLVPLLGYGLLQPVQCYGPTMTGTCAGEGLSTPANAFRIGSTTPVSGFGCTAAPCWDGLVAPLATPTTPPCTATQLCKTLPQPAFPGFNSLAAGAVTTTDPNFRPNKSYEFDFTIQRQITPKIMVETGYIGRLIRNEFQPISPNGVPYMFTLGGQRFDKAYANLETEYCGGALGSVAGLAGGGCAGNTAAVTPQAFFETALGGTGSAYCKGFSSCTAAIVANEGLTGTQNLAVQNVWALWTDLESGLPASATNSVGAPIPAAGLPSPYLAVNGGALSGPELISGNGQLSSDGIGVNTSHGYGNYNSLFITARMADWHGLTEQSNFTYGKALGTSALVQASSEATVDDPFDISRNYGPQTWDRKFVFNTFLVYQPPYYKNQQGVIGHILGGWAFSPILTAGSGNPLSVGTITSASDFGASNAESYFNQNQAVPIAGCAVNHSTSRQNGVPGSSGVGTGLPFSLNLYTNPAADFMCFRDPILGFDNGDNGGFGNTLRGQPYWNVDIQVTKRTRITERISFEFQVIAANVFNKTQFYDPFMSLGVPSYWGALYAQENVGRQFNFGGRIRF